MYDKDFKNQSFSELSKDAIDFLKYIVKEAKFHVDLCEMGELENTFYNFENRLKEKAKFNDKLMQLLYKVQRSRKLLRKLHETWENESDKAQKNTIIAVRGEASYEELEAILKKPSKIVWYYNYQEIREVLLRKKRGEIADEYFKSWLILLSNSLNCDKYEFLSGYFDACSFCDKYDEKTLSEILATLKDFDYRLTHEDFIGGHKRDKLKVIYLRHIFFNTSSDSKIFMAYFVDYKKKRYDVRIIDDAIFDYKDELMYCDILSFHLDNEGDYMDSDDEYSFEPAELPEEKQLSEMFYQEGWTCDHELNF